MGASASYSVYCLYYYAAPYSSAFLLLLILLICFLVLSINLLSMAYMFCFDAMFMLARAPQLGRVSSGRGL